MNLKELLSSPKGIYLGNGWRFGWKTQMIQGASNGLSLKDRRNDFEFAVAVRTRFQFYGKDSGALLICLLDSYKYSKKLIDSFDIQRYKHLPKWNELGGIDLKAVTDPNCLFYVSYSSLLRNKKNIDSH